MHLKARGPKSNKQNGMPILIDTQKETSKRHQDSQIALLTDSLQKASEKLKTQQVPKTKDYTADTTPTAPPRLPSPEYSVY